MFKDFAPKSAKICFQRIIHVSPNIVSYFKSVDGFTYKKSSSNTRCSTAQNKLASYCDCRQTFSTCKKTCDTDPNCKGYSGSVGPDDSVDDLICNLATTSDCASLGNSCSGSYRNNDGALHPSATCSFQNWTGCYIKQ